MLAPAEAVRTQNEWPRNPLRVVKADETPWKKNATFKGFPFNWRTLVPSHLKRNAGLCFELCSVTRWAERASRVPGARVSGALDVAQPPERRAYRLLGVGGAERAETRRQQPAHGCGDRGAAGTGKDARLRPGGGRRAARGLPEEVTSGRVRSEGSPDPGHQQVSSPESSQHHVLTLLPRTWCCKKSEGPASQIQGAAGLGQLILLRKKWTIYHGMRPGPETGGMTIL